MKISYAKAAAKVINAMDEPTKQRIRQAVNALPAGDVRPLQGAKGSFRLRVGGWRVLFSYPDRDAILIEKIGPRGEIYKGVS